MNAKYDVVIVGAGPAGAWTACRLAQGGARVALLDPSHPREKPCGGGVTGRALALVADALRDHALPAVRVRTVQVLGRKSFTKRPRTGSPFSSLRYPMIRMSYAYEMRAPKFALTAH